MSRSKIPTTLPSASSKRCAPRRSPLPPFGWYSLLSRTSSSPVCQPRSKPVRERRFVAAFLIFLGSARIAPAQEGPAIRLSLEEAQARAVQTSHRLAEAQAREAAAQATVAGRQAAQRPLIAAVAGYTRTNHVVEFTVPGPTGAPRVLYPDVPDNYRTRIDLQWPIYTGGRADALERASRAEAAAVAAEVTVAQADLRLEFARAFWALGTARSTFGVL